MRWFFANLTVIFWSFIFGMIVGYIGGDLAGASVSYVEAGITAAVAAVIAVNGVRLFQKSQN